MEGFLHQIVSGLATGGIYASLALALAMIYQSTHLINFAQGEMAMFTAYIAWALLNSGVSYLLAFACSVCAGFCIGVLTERLVIRRLDGRSPLSVVVVFIGLLVLFNSLAGSIWTYTIKAFPSPFAQIVNFESRYITTHEIGVVVTTLIVLAAVFFLMNHTDLGLAMRASAQNPVSSRLVGIRVGLTICLGWGVSGMIGSFAGLMVAPILFLEPNMMFGILLYGFAGALLGGISNPWGAVAGGLIVGVLENLLGAYIIGSELKLTVALLLIISVLLMRPAGLFGRPVLKRV